MKKTLLTLLLFLLTLAVSACAIQSFGSIENNNQAGRVLVLTGREAENPDAYAAAQALSARYGRYLRHQELDAQTVADPRRYAAAVLKAVADAKADAVILAPAYAGAAAACAETPALAIALRPREEAALIAGAADLVLDADYGAAGAMAAAQAAELGASAFVYYQSNRLDENGEMLEQARAAAVQAGLAFIVEPLPKGDVAAGLDSRLERLAPLYAGKGAALSEPSAATEGEDDCVDAAVLNSLALFSDDAGAEEQIIAAALRHGCICPPQPSLTPYGAYGRVFGVTEPGERYGGLLGYLKQVNRKLVTELKLNGFFAAWRRPLDFVEMDAAAEYAFLRLAGRTPEDGSQFRQCLLNANAKAISTYDRDGAAYANYWLHLINIRVFDESG